MPVRVARRRVDLDAHERVAQLTFERGEPGSGRELVTRESQADEAEVGVGLTPLLDPGEVVVAHADVG